MGSPAGMSLEVEEVIHRGMEQQIPQPGSSESQGPLLP